MELKIIGYLLRFLKQKKKVLNLDLIVIKLFDFENTLKTYIKEQEKKQLRQIPH